MFEKTNKGISFYQFNDLLKPIGPGEELLVRYSVQDNPEITAALEEERVSRLSKKISPELNEDVTFPEVHPSALRVA
ncbi:unnamed protein product [Arctogadus glacialis]